MAYKVIATVHNIQSSIMANGGSKGGRDHGKDQGAPQVGGEHLTQLLEVVPISSFTHFSTNENVSPPRHPRHLSPPGVFVLIFDACPCNYCFLQVAVVAMAAGIRSADQLVASKASVDSQRTATY